MAEFVPGRRVIISKPRSFAGGVGPWEGRKGRLETVSGRFVTLVLDGELDELGFFTDEVDILPET